MPLLYKYRSFTTPEDRKRLFEIIKTERFWFAMANEVNDPFEFRCAVEFNWDRTATEEAFAKIECLMNPSTAQAEALAKVRKVFAGVSPEKLRERQWELAFNLWRGLSQRISLSCFAGTPENTLMWSHYAAGHTGVAIEVDPIGLDENINAVIYSDEVIRLRLKELAGIEVSKTLFDSLFLRKAKCWEYEREYRIMRIAPQSHAISFGKGSIKRVIIGCAMPLEAQQQLITWMNENAPGVHIAAALPSHERAYSLQVVDLTELDSGEVPRIADPVHSEGRRRWFWGLIVAGAIAGVAVGWRR